MHRTESNLTTWEEPLAGLLRVGIAEILDRVAGTLYDPDRTARTGIDAFDRLSQGQQAYLLNRVARALLDESVEAPPLNQAIEATTMAISLGITAAIASEIKPERGRSSPDPGQCYAIGMLRKSHLWVSNQFWAGSEPHPMPQVRRAHLDDWQEMIDGLFEGVFFDFDMLDEPVYAKLPLEKRRELLASMMIEEDYYDWCPREPKQHDFEVLVQEIEALVTRQPGRIEDEVIPGWVKETHVFQCRREGSNKPIAVTVWSGGRSEGAPFVTRTACGRYLWREARGRYRDAITEELLLCDNEPSLNDLRDDP